MDPRADLKIEELILRELYRHPGHEAILLPSLFNPPIMLSNIFRIACGLKKKGYTTAPDRRMGGWHMRLQPPGIAYCEGKAHGSRRRRRAHKIKTVRYPCNQSRSSPRNVCRELADGILSPG